MLLTRRSIFKCAAAAIATVTVAQPTTKRFGRLTIQGWTCYRNRTGRELSVLVNGIDVTRRCVLADDRRGYVVLHRNDSDGHCYLDARGKVAREILKWQDVRIVEVPIGTYDQSPIQARTQMIAAFHQEPLA